MNKIILTLHFLILFVTISGQIGIDSVLSAVSKNNQSIQTQNQYWKAQNISHQVGLTPYDPSVGFDYMKGTPAGAGNQIDFTATQSFDFPTVYFNKKQLSKSQIVQSDYHIQAVKQTILLEAKLVCIELIYLNKLNHKLKQRYEHAQKLYNDYNIKLSKGEGNIVEVNKAKMNLINMQSQLLLNEGEIKAQNQKLTQLNGGNFIAFNDTVLPSEEFVPTADVLDSLYQQNDPNFKILQQQNVITQLEIDLSKSMWFPKFETGYHYQSILGQTFNGVHIGMTIPLWQNKNTVNQKEAESLFTKNQFEEYKITNQHAIAQLYENYSSLKTSYYEYKNFINALTSTEALEKSLKAGEISSIEYFLELGNYYLTYDNFLRIEMEYFSVVARLNKFNKLY